MDRRAREADWPWWGHAAKFLIYMALMGAFYFAIARPAGRLVEAAVKWALGGHP